MIAELLHLVAGMDRDEFQYAPRPSSAGPDRCIRQMVYQRTGTPRDRELPARILHVLDDSAWHEELTADWIGKTSYILHSRQMGATLPGVLDWRDARKYTCTICQKTIDSRDLHGQIGRAHV